MPLPFKKLANCNTTSIWRKYGIISKCCFVTMDMQMLHIYKDIVYYLKLASCMECHLLSYRGSVDKEDTNKGTDHGTERVGPKVCADRNFLSLESLKAMQPVVWALG